MEQPDLIECDSGKHKSVELLCRTARGMQESGNAVSFSEIEDALVNVHTVGKLSGKVISDVNDLKDIIRPAMAKSDKAVRAFNDAFTKALDQTFHKKANVKSADDLSKELQ